jgi:hypothetical protein
MVFGLYIDRIAPDKPFDHKLNCRQMREYELFKNNFNTAQSGASLEFSHVSCEVMLLTKIAHQEDFEPLTTWSFLYCKFENIL